MTIKDPRLAQIAINIKDQHTWLVRTVWANPDRTPQDATLLRATEDLLTNAYALLELIQKE
jgi:hypothetical protein